MVEEIGEEEEIRLEEDIKQVHRETQTQWMSIEEEEGIGRVITVRSLAIWPETVGKGIRRE